MPRDPRQVTFLRPAAVSIRDNRDVSRQARQIQLLEKLRLFRSHRTQRLQGWGARRFVEFSMRHNRVCRSPSVETPLRRKVNIRRKGYATKYPYGAPKGHFSSELRPTDAFHEVRNKPQRP